ncbi:MAG: hypothetical protein QOF02_1568 [Blastocatellia bacterium]|jgi:hypothetical protein|nr:hypothetical protein [Blastocatellia bacterium]
MSDWIGLGFILLVVFGGLYLLARPAKPVTQEEFEKRAAESPSLMSAGVMGLQKILDPAADKAVAAVQDMRQGYLDGEQESGDDNDTTPPAAADELNSNDKEKLNSNIKEEEDA